MDLGNWAFGNSRGQFQLDRDMWTEVFRPIFDKMVFFDSESFENDVFKVHPYFWGDCTCDEEAGVTPECPAHRPNFVYKPTGLEVMWYKHPFRDSYANQALTREQVEAVVSACLATLEEDT